MSLEVVPFAVGEAAWITDTHALSLSRAVLSLHFQNTLLGHTSLAVTGRYLARLNHSENAHLGKLSSLYGIPADGEDETE